MSGVECLDTCNCAQGLIDLGLDLEHHGLVDWDHLSMGPGMGLAMGLELKAPWDKSPWDEMIDPLGEAIEQDRRGGRAVRPFDG